MKNGFDWVATEKIEGVGVGVSDMKGKRELVFLGKLELVEKKFLLKIDYLESFGVLGEPVVIEATLAKGNGGASELVV